MAVIDAKVFAGALGGVAASAIPEPYCAWIEGFEAKHSKLQIPFAPLLEYHRSRSLTYSTQIITQEFTAGSDAAPSFYAQPVRGLSTDAGDTPFGTLLRGPPFTLIEQRIFSGTTDGWPEFHIDVSAAAGASFRFDIEFVDFGITLASENGNRVIDGAFWEYKWTGSQTPFVDGTTYTVKITMYDVLNSDGELFTGYEMPIVTNGVTLVPSEAVLMGRPQLDAGVVMMPSDTYYWVPSQLAFASGDSPWWLFTLAVGGDQVPRIQRGNQICPLPGTAYIWVNDYTDGEDTITPRPLGVPAPHASSPAGRPKYDWLYPWRDPDGADATAYPLAVCTTSVTSEVKSGFLTSVETSNLVAVRWTPRVGGTGFAGQWDTQVQDQCDNLDGGDTIGTALFPVGTRFNVQSVVDTNSITIEGPEDAPYAALCHQTRSRKHGNPDLDESIRWEWPTGKKFVADWYIPNGATANITDHGLLPGDSVRIRQLTQQMVWESTASMNLDPDSVTYVRDMTPTAGTIEFVGEAVFDVFRGGVLQDPDNPDSQRSRSYVYTYVNDEGWEGPPSLPSAIFDASDGDVITITSFGDAGAGTLKDEYFITHRRIYRTATTDEGTDFFFVAEVPIAATTYADSILDEELGEVLSTSEFNQAPPFCEGFTSIKELNLSVLWIDNKMYFSEPGFPYAFPVDNVQTTSWAVSNMTFCNNSIYVLTVGKPVVVYGSRPSEFTMRTEDAGFECSAPLSVTVEGAAVYYASIHGVVRWLPNGQFEMISRDCIPDDMWRGSLFGIQGYPGYSADTHTRNAVVLGAFVHENEYWMSILRTESYSSARKPSAGFGAIGTPEEYSTLPIEHWVVRLDTQTPTFRRLRQQTGVIQGASPVWDGAHSNGFKDSGTGTLWQLTGITAAPTTEVVAGSPRRVGQLHLHDGVNVVHSPGEHTFRSRTYRFTNAWSPSVGLISLRNDHYPASEDDPPTYSASLGPITVRFQVWGKDERVKDTLMYDVVLVDQGVLNTAAAGWGHEPSAGMDIEFRIAQSFLSTEIYFTLLVSGEPRSLTYVDRIVLADSWRALQQATIDD